MKPRTLAQTILKAAKTFPAVVVTGPRQSGKTTLLKSLLAKTHAYASLENIDVRVRAREDPAGFLAALGTPIILDEIQYVPELLSYIKTAIDERRLPGQWVLTGSQNFVLAEGVAQSLAGRAAVLSLLPFSLAERFNRGAESLEAAKLLKKPILATKTTRPSPDPAEVILRGNFPEIASNPQVDRQLWCGSYITTYLERDVRNIKQVGDLGQFEKFIGACAIRTGQLLNLAEISREIGVSGSTAKRWLSLLQTGYQIFLLPPYFQNIGKRLVKSPKLYFMDTGLASFLLGLHSKEALLASPYYPHLFETLIVTDFLKRFLNFGQRPPLFFLKTRDGLEVDLAVELEGRLSLLEIKSGATITAKHAEAVRRARSDLGEKVSRAALISNSRESFVLKDNISNYRWTDLLLR